MLEKLCTKTYLWVGLILLTEGVLATLFCDGRMLRKATLVDFATSDGSNLSTFADIFQSLGLEWVFKVPGPIRIFAPTNKAFDTFVSQDLNISYGELLDSNSLIEKLLAFHIVLGNASTGTQATLLPGYTVSIENETVIDGMGNTGNITEEVNAANGQLLVIDRVLIPAIDESPVD